MVSLEKAANKLGKIRLEYYSPYLVKGLTIHVDERLRRALHNLGLTDYEIKVYVVLVEKGGMTANQVSEAAEVPYSKIYEVLDSLEKKGWVGSEGGRPAKYYPKSPATALEANRMRVERELKENESIVLSELLPIYEGAGAREKHDIWILRGEANILAKIRSLLRNCEEELQAATPWMSKEILEFLLPSLATIVGRGGRVQVMLSSACDYRVIKKLSRVAEVRLRDQMYGGGIIADSQEVVLILSTDKQDSFNLAIWSEHVGLARLAKIYFEHLWSDADPVEPG